MPRVQVRTAKMHAEAEGGAAAHSLYKANLENPAEASLFRSKMTPNNSPPAQHQLPSRSRSDRATPAADNAATVPAMSSSTPLTETELEQPGDEGEGRARRASHLESSRNPEP